jgi:hypothetical protein
VRAAFRAGQLTSIVRRARATFNAAPPQLDGEDPNAVGDDELPAAEDDGRGPGGAGPSEGVCREKLRTASLAVGLASQTHGNTTSYTAVKSWIYLDLLLSCPLAAGRNGAPGRRSPPAAPSGKAGGAGGLGGSTAGVPDWVLGGSSLLSLVKEEARAEPARADRVGCRAAAQSLCRLFAAVAWGS